MALYSYIMLYIMDLYRMALYTYTMLYIMVLYSII